MRLLQLFSIMIGSGLIFWQELLRFGNLFMKKSQKTVRANSNLKIQPNEKFPFCVVVYDRPLFGQIENPNPIVLNYTPSATGAYVVEVASVIIPARAPYFSWSIGCGQDTNAILPLPEMQVFFQGTNLPNGSTLTFPATTTLVPTNLSLLITNPGTAPLVISLLTNTADFTLSNNIVGNLPPFSSTNLTIRFNASSNEICTGELLFQHNAYDGVYFAYLVGSAFPTGAPPSVSLSSPLNNSTNIAPADITLVATGSSSTNLSYVEFRQIDSSGTIILGRATNAPYTITLPNMPAADYVFSALAVDAASRSATASPITVHVIYVPFEELNRPPLAVEDDVTVFANSVNNVIYPLANDSDPDGDPLRIIAIDTPAFGSARIAPNGQSISYTPQPGFDSTVAGQLYPGDGFRYWITDGQGGTNWAWVVVSIFATDQPTVTLSPTDTPTVSAGTVVPIVAQVIPSDYITKVEFFLGETSIGVVTNGSGAFFTNNWTALYAQCHCGINAQATDRFGQVGSSQPIHINVTLPSGLGIPLAAIENFVGASTNYGPVAATNLAIMREGRFDLYGVAYHSMNSNVVWQLDLYNPDGTLIRQITSSTNSVTSSNLLAHCDFTTLQNGVYDLRLTVTGGYAMTNTSVRFQLESNLKIGQFGFSQQDIALPVNGIPLTVVRTYSSLNPLKGDFGYGWTWALNDMQVEIDETREDVTDFYGKPINLRTGGGRDVTLTLPNGQRTTFYFSLDYHGGVGTYYANWNPAPGVTAKLTPSVDNELQSILEIAGGDPYWQAAAPSIPMDNFDFPGFTLQTLDGTKYLINRKDLGSHTMTNDSSGFLVHTWGQPYLSQIIERNNNTITIGSDGVICKDPGGNITRRIAFAKNSNGLITSISDPNGMTSDGITNGPPAMRYEYDASQNLLNVQSLVDRTGPGTYVTNSFEYTNATFPHYITGIINANGTQVARNEYDDAGRITAVVDADGNRIEYLHSLTNNMEVHVDRMHNTNTFVYDSRGNVTATTNALGGITLMGYDDLNNKTNEVMFLNGQPYATNRSVCDPANGFLLASFDPLEASNLFTYNAQGQLLTSRDARGNTSTNYYDPVTGNLLASSDALANLSSNYFDAGSGLLVGSRDAVGTLTTNYYDGAGNLTATAMLDALRNILSTNSFEYDGNGNQVRSIVWRRLAGVWLGATNTIVYDAQNRVVQTIAPDGGTNITVYDATGKQIQTIDALGRANAMEYDAQGRLIRATFADGTFTLSFYDANGGLTNRVDQLGHGTTNLFDRLGRQVKTIYADGASTQIVYDDLGRAVTNIDARGNLNVAAFDAAGRRTATTNGWTTPVATWTHFGYDLNGNQTTVTDALNHATTTIFDGLNRAIQVQYADGSNTFTGFDAVGRRVAETNQESIVNRFAYDGDGRLTAVTNGFGAAQSTWALYSYDEAGNQLTQVDALGRTTGFAYDSMGRRISRTLPGLQVESMGYDLAGNLVRLTNFNGIVITNQYDVMNRLTNRASTNGYSVAFAYSATGQRTNMSDPSGVTSYVYDERDRLKANRSPEGTLYYDYDANGNVSNVWSATAGGAYTRYAYDSLNRLTTVSNLVTGAWIRAAQYGFDSVGNLQATTLANGLTNRYQYDALNRLTSLAWKSNNLTIASFDYTLGGTGHRTALTETLLTAVTNRTYTWAYDSLYRLTDEGISGIGTNSYTLDRVGNRTARNSGMAGQASQNFAYGTNDWMNTDVYDANGNTLWTTNTGAAVGPYAYDVENRLISVSNGTVTFAYNGDGARVRKTVGGITTLFLVDDRNPTGWSQTLEESTASGGSTNLTRVYTFGLGILSQREPAGTLYYFISDDHGSSRLLTGSSGGISNAFSFDAYGNLISSNAAPQTAHLFCGEYFDPYLRMYYLRARYYNIELGRFPTPDSLEGVRQEPATLHRYMYVRANPITGLDPSGHEDIGDLMFSAGVWGADPILSGILNYQRGGFGDPNKEQLPEPSDPALKANDNSVFILNSTKNVDELFQRTENLNVDTSIATPDKGVSGLGNRIKWTPGGLLTSAGQTPFYVTVKKFVQRQGQEGEGDHFFSVATMGGHPLSGWRFWRVFRVSGGVVVQTGAVDKPARIFPRLGNFMFGAKKEVLNLWKAQMQDALKFGGNTRGSGPFDHIDGEFEQANKQAFLNLVQ